MAQIVAVRHSLRVRSLTTIMTAINVNEWAGKAFAANTPFFMDILSHPSPKEGMDLESFIKNRVSVRSMLITDKCHPPPLSEEEEQLLVAEMREEYQRGALDWGDQGGLRRMVATNAWIDLKLSSHRVALERLRIPTLVLHGKFDQLIPVEAGVELSNTIKGSKFVQYNGGHNLPLDEQRSVIVPEIVQHLQQN